MEDVHVISIDADQGTGLGQATAGNTPVRYGLGDVQKGRAQGWVRQRPAVHLQGRGAGSDQRGQVQGWVRQRLAVHL